LTPRFDQACVVNGQFECETGDNEEGELVDERERERGVDG